MAERHVLGISGGKDSAALAVYMATKHPDLDIEYFYTDTGEELPGGLRVPGQARGQAAQADPAVEPQPRLQVLAAPIQPLPAQPQLALVHAEVEARTV